MLAQQKATFLAELFSVELKFTLDFLNDWFSAIIKPKFLAVGSIKTQNYRKKNRLDKQKPICSICGFLLDVKNVGWFDFVVRCEHLFLRNIYFADDLEKMNIKTEEKYSEIVYKV